MSWRDRKSPWKGGSGRWLGSDNFLAFASWPLGKRTLSVPFKMVGDPVSPFRFITAIFKLMFLIQVMRVPNLQRMHSGAELHLPWKKIVGDSQRDGTGLSPHPVCPPKPFCSLATLSTTPLELPTPKYQRRIGTQVRKMMTLVLPLRLGLPFSYVHTHHLFNSHNLR